MIPSVCSKYPLMVRSLKNSCFFFLFYSSLFFLHLMVTSNSSFSSLRLFNLSSLSTVSMVRAVSTEFLTFPSTSLSSLACSFICSLLSLYLLATLYASWVDKNI